MRATKTKTTDIDQRLAVDLSGLTELLSCGQASAMKIAEDAGAKIKIGRRVIYSVSKIEQYLNENSGC